MYETCIVKSELLVKNFYYSESASAVKFMPLYKSNKTQFAIPYSQILGNGVSCILLIFPVS